MQEVDDKLKDKIIDVGIVIMLLLNIFSYFYLHPPAIPRLPEIQDKPIEMKSVDYTYYAPTKSGKIFAQPAGIGQPTSTPDIVSVASNMILLSSIDLGADVEKLFDYKYVESVATTSLINDVFIVQLTATGYASFKQHFNDAWACAFQQTFNFYPQIKELVFKYQRETLADLAFEYKDYCGGYYVMSVEESSNYWNKVEGIETPTVTEPTGPTFIAPINPFIGYNMFVGDTY